MYQSRKIIRADGPASAAYTGKSIGIAVLDTGIYPHEDFILPSDRIAAFRDFVHRQPAPYDDNGHAALLPAMAAVPRDDTGESLRNPTL